MTTYTDEAIQAAMEAYNAAGSTHNLEGDLLTAAVEFCARQSAAEHARGAYSMKCIVCSTPVFMVPADEAMRPGHINTRLGMREFQISRCCEHCFDRMFKEPEEDEPEPARHEWESADRALRARPESRS